MSSCLGSNAYRLVRREVWVSQWSERLSLDSRWQEAMARNSLVPSTARSGQREKPQDQRRSVGIQGSHPDAHHTLFLFPEQPLPSFLFEVSPSLHTCQAPVSQAQPWAHPYLSKGSAFKGLPRNMCWVPIPHPPERLEGLRSKVWPFSVTSINLLPEMCWSSPWDPFYQEALRTWYTLLLCPLQYSWASLVAQLVKKNLPAMWEAWVLFLG